MFRLALIMAAVFASATQGAAIFPSVQVVPLPYQEVAFEIDGHEVARYYGSDDTTKPFLFPLIGPAGKRLTTMSHPIDPFGHRHHRSVWVGHRDVNGHNFWEETDGSRIVMTRLEAYGHEAGAAWFRAAHEWRAPDDKVVVNEQRTWKLTRLDGGEYYLDLTMAFTPAGADVVFAQTPYGLLGVRVTPSMSVSEGEGRILNSQGDLNEAGVHWKAARWVDYSGKVTPDTVNGATFFDHPDNPGFPATFHVRDEGWMSASFTYNAPYTLKPGETLTLTYRIFVHGPEEDQAALEAHWAAFAGR